MSLSLGIFGTGRLGTLVADAAHREGDVELRWAGGRQMELTSLDPVDVAIDVSHADAVADHLVWAQETGTPLVLGTTGWDRELLADAATSAAGVLIAPNFSLSVALLTRLTAVLGRYAQARAACADTDLSVLDRHHRHKVDAPSGTAALLLDTLRAAAPAAHVDIISQRIGSAVGFHEVRYTDGTETLTLSHEAHDRAVFAEGAIAAARWLHRSGRPGLHTFDELADDLLAPLFLGATPTHHDTGTNNHTGRS